MFMYEYIEKQDTTDIITQILSCTSYKVLTLLTIKMYMICINDLYLLYAVYIYCIYRLAALNSHVAYYILYRLASIT